MTNGKVVFVQFNIRKGMSNNVISRKELYNLVWSKPMITLAKKYSITDSGLRKVCKMMNIPLPKPGNGRE